MKEERPAHLMAGPYEVINEVQETGEEDGTYENEDDDQFGHLEKNLQGFSYRKMTD